MFACGKWLLQRKSPGGSMPRPYGVVHAYFYYFTATHLILQQSPPEKSGGLF